MQLNGDPLATYTRTKPPKGKKIDFTSNTARAYRAQLSNLRNDYKAWLRANVPQARVSGEFDISLNAVAVKLNGATLAQVSAHPSVLTAQYQGLYRPNVVAGTPDPDLALINGLVWGGIIGLIASLLYGSASLGLVMTAAMTLNLMLAATIGVMIPMLMVRAGRDPAMGSSVMITACTDSGGFFIFLGLATLFLL